MLITSSPPWKRAVKGPPPALSAPVVRGATAARSSLKVPVGPRAEGDVWGCVRLPERGRWVSLALPLLLIC